MNFIWIALIKCPVSGCIDEEQFDYEFTGRGLSMSDFKAAAVREFCRLGWVQWGKENWYCTAHSSLVTRPSPLTKEAA